MVSTVSIFLSLNTTLNIVKMRINSKQNEGVQMDKIKEYIVNHYDTAIIVLQIVITFVVAFLLTWVVAGIMRRLQKKFRVSPNIWRDTFVAALCIPLNVLIWVESLTFVIELILNKWPVVGIIEWVDRINLVCFVIIVGWMLMRWVNHFGEEWKEVKQTDELTLGFRIDVFGKLIKSIIFIITSVTALGCLKVDLTAIVTFGGVGVAAVGLASKDVLANFFGGFMVHVTRPFGVGEWISSPDRNIEGTVSEIGWYMTKIYSFAKRPIYVPNSVFSNAVVQNHTRMLCRRIKETIGIRYDDFTVVKDVIEDIRVMLKEHKGISNEFITLVNFVTYGDSSLDIMVYTFADTKDWATYLDIQQDVLLKIGDIIAKHGAEIAFPTRTLDVPSFVEVVQGSEKS